MCFSPLTLKNQHRQLARDTETKLISKCAKEKNLERPPKTRNEGIFIFKLILFISIYFELKLIQI